MKVRPLHDRVLVIRLAAPDTQGKEGKLFRPDAYKTPPQEAVVIAVGEGRSYDGPGTITTHPTSGRDEGYKFGMEIVISRQTPRLKEGDIVLFGKFSGSEVELSDRGQTLFLLREDEVIAVIDEPTPELRHRADEALLAHAGEPVAN